MYRVLLLFCLIVAAFPVRAADSTGAAAAPNADSPEHQAVTGQNATATENCPKRPPLAEGAPSAVIVQLDPDTLWRPRGSEVRFTISNPGGTVAVTKVRVCFGWSSTDGNFGKDQALIGSPQVRSVSNDSGAVEYAALVPFLHKIPASDWWPRRIVSQAAYVFTGAFVVPVADMVVEVTTSAAPGGVVVTATQVGVTSVAVAWVVVIVVAGLVWVIMNAIARHRHIRGRNLLLRVISTQDGYASLSQLQIVLWTLVVGLSAIYVMTLSGNLISISEGTLILLGIASGAALAARIPAAKQKPVVGDAAAAVVVPVTEPATPEWSDLVISDRTTQEIDVTRLQMLAFTLITAAFVVIKVVVDYEIPAIPANFLVLMGISNGVYVGGRQLPSQPKKVGTAPDI
jgi:hypothetical protein